MYILYDILVHIAFVLLIPYFSVRMVFGGKYRSGLAERFGFIPKEKLTRLSGARVVWFHAVSVGETKAVMPLVRLFKETHPGFKVVFSTVTPTGQRVAAQDGEDVFDALIYLPLELGWVVRRVVGAIAPEAFIVVEKEVWPNVLKTLFERYVPVVVVNGTVSGGSFRRYRFFSFFFRRVFSALGFFLARTGEDARRARELGVPAERVVVAGNLKFDFTPPAGAHDIDRLARELGIGPADRVLVAGSTHAGEETLLIGSYIELRREFKGLKLVIAPRHPERFDEVEKLFKEAGVAPARRSRGGEPGSGSGVLLLDTIGELSAVYALSTVAFVGGTLVDIGGHNLLEPAFFAKPVVYGPYLASCLDMAEMLERSGGGFRVAGGEELTEKLAGLLRSDSARMEAGRAARRVVEDNSGATETSARVIEGVLKGGAR
jgi:3-deoxy-D-manno-octulosonic-acid transferase